MIADPTTDASRRTESCGIKRSNCIAVPIPATVDVPIPTMWPKSPSYLISVKISWVIDSDSTNTDGGFVLVYPEPAFVILIADTVPRPDTVASAVAFVDVVPIPAWMVPIPAVTPIETCGATV